MILSRIYVNTSLKGEFIPSNYGNQGKSLKHIGEAHRPYARMINFREGKERVSVAGTVSLIGDV